MTLRNFHVDANVTVAQLLKQSDGLLKNLAATFRQMLANGNFSIAGIKLQAADINRVHSIVTEIDSRRVFYECGEDENPPHAMQSILEARSAIRDTAKGIWAAPACELAVKEIIATLNTFCTRAERLQSGDPDFFSPDHREFINLITEMRLKVWQIVALLAEKLGSVIQVRNLPDEILHQVRDSEICTNVR